MSFESDTRGRLISPSDKMKNLNMLIGGAFSVVLGLCFVIWHKSFGSGAVRFQHKLLNIQFDERIFQITYLIVGIAFIVIGVGVLFSTAAR